MATTKPGEIRCPTCHRSTPPAAFCTQCGAAIPPDLRVRPRGMDRDELQERIRARRSGGDPYRRGLPASEGGPGYERFEPDPQDATARREGGPASDRRVDRFDESAAPAPVTRDPEPDDWPQADRWERQEPEAEEGVAAAPYAPPVAGQPYEEPGYQADPHYEEAVGHPGPYAGDYAAEPEGDADYPYAYEEWDGGRRSGGGGGAMAIIGFLALGVLALLGGAFLANVFGNGDTASAPSPTPSATLEATPAPTVAPSAAPTDGESAAPSGSPSAGDGPVTFPDGATIFVEACASQRMNHPTEEPPGCLDDGSVITGDAMWVWMGFHRAFGADALVLSLRSSETTIDQQTRVIGEQVSCADPCTGYLIQGYRGLQAGEYELVIERNGEFADSTTFRVDG